MEEVNSVVTEIPLRCRRVHLLDVVYPLLPGDHSRLIGEDATLWEPCRLCAIRRSRLFVEKVSSFRESQVVFHHVLVKRRLVIVSDVKICLDARSSGHTVLGAAGWSGRGYWRV